MGTVILGTEAIAAGHLTPGQLRYGYRRVYPNVYVPRDFELSPIDSAVAAWLWSGRRAIITGRAAAALHGARWISEKVPIELAYDCKRPPVGIIARNDRIGDDEVIKIGSVLVASVPRTAFDLGRYLPLDRAVAHLDALANATGLTADRVRPLMDRYRGARGMKTLRAAVELMDGGAQSPRETWLRLWLVKNGLPRPRTQIPVLNDRGIPFAYLDMGWEDVRIAVEYDGAHHQTDRAQYIWDEQRLRLVRARDWLHIKVINEDDPREIIARVKRAWVLRESASSVADLAS
ncbi:cullin, a subunit of E3 ubiquitin ligase [Mycolicibacterium aurum]|uniref:Cullin, a subunit of E3 ubiquitin ligase n=1 Tax=Mycolicibacterium aurum TaxID=1791 RepID=A0A3S4RU02_MYCAU|nr:hypothetical protein [Mycolicibacterium aurum]VEG52390.1 cullin, a subunit of E3 ubiquitin ligase [Mycolicibacterium aurum]